jgi:hypothetical protein
MPDGAALAAADPVPTTIIPDDPKSASSAHAFANCGLTIIIKTLA